MNTYFALFLIATFSSLTITPLIRRLCERLKLLDVPVDGRRLHRKAVPRLGGVAIYLSCLFALSVLPFVDNLLTQTLRQQSGDIFVAMVPATLVLFLGIYDDLRGTNATVKFVALGLIATLFYIMGGRIEALSIPFLGSVELPGTVALLLTVFWLVAIANAFNLIDGVDGLASGAALFSSLVILGVSIAQARPLTIVVALVLCGALAGFLRYNFNPASIFLGDSGALFVGFTLAALSVLGTQKATTTVAVVMPILAFGLPVVDTTVTMARRLISRRPMFEGDNEHIHHMLLARGWSQRRVVIILYAVCAAFGMVAMLFAGTGSNLTTLVLFVLSVAVIIAVGHLRYHEVDELKAGVKRTVADRRNKVANNIRVRRAAIALSRASDLGEIFEALKEMLEVGEFAYANAQLGRPDETALNLSVFNEVSRRHPLPEAELRNGGVFWSWTRPDITAEPVVGSNAFWCFRLPLTTGATEWGWINLYHSYDGERLLVDLNYLSGPFRKELSEAAARAFTAHVSPAAASAELRMSVSAGNTLR